MFTRKLGAITTGFGLLLASILVVWTEQAGAFNTYSINRNDVGNCAQCHGEFSTAQNSLKDGSWGDNLHDVHRYNMLSGDCSTCHFGTGTTGREVTLNDSAGGSGLDPIACVGCHGRAEDRGDNPDDCVGNQNPLPAACGPTQPCPPPTATEVCGDGAGLRQHHFNSGVTLCASCHLDADPLNFVTVGENVAPPYYFTPDAVHPNKPTDPCNPAPAFNEDFAGGILGLGLDNDGDDFFDANDLDCAAGVCGDGTLDAGEECDDGNTAPGDCCAADCTLEPNGSACGDSSDTGCDNPDSCLAGACETNLEPDGAACGDPSDTGCDNPDSCLAGSCETNLEPAGTPCDDLLFCNINETCNAAGTCGGGVPNSCDDGIGCTDDSCDEGADACVNSANDANCPDDALFCNGTEFCDPLGDCSSTGDPCLAGEACNEVGDVCEALCGNGTLDAGEDCDDGNTAPGDCCAANCTLEPNGSACGDPSDTGCDNPDSCLAGSCEPNPEPAGTPCDDLLFCNLNETCTGAGACGGGSPNSCDDGIGCTDDSCDEGADACVNSANDANCPDDALFCNGTEFCDALFDCSSTGDPCLATEVCDEVGDVCEVPAACGDGTLDAGEDCDDGNTAPGDCCAANCTLEPNGSACGDPSNTACDNPDSCLAGTCETNLEPAGTPCDDLLFCNSNETCDAAGTCGGGSPNSCDDGIGCTDDSCDEGADACVNSPNDANCPDDALFCNGTEFCDPLGDCSSTGDPCLAGEACNEVGDVCEALCGNGTLDAGEDCDDGNTAPGDCCAANCTLEPNGSACGDPSDTACDNPDSCLAGTCETNLEPAGTPCDDLLFCNSNETCDAAGTCGGGSPNSCDDGIGCTDDSCDEVADVCVNSANDANCPDDALFCNGTEFCDALGDCSSTGDPCLATEICDEVGDVCELPAACGDGILDAGEDCDDGNTAPGDCCAPNCTLEPNGSPCGDPSDSTCDNPDSCVAGACEPNLEPAGTPCDDLLFCNSNETCDAAGTCGGGSPNSCDDGIGCTDDSCDEGADACVNAANDANCPDDAAFCNGTEYCDPIADCSSMGDPCPAGETCDESADVCAAGAACGAAPQTSCLEAARVKLQYSEKVAGKEKAKLQWKKISTLTTQADFGDPVATDTAATVCIYDDAGGLVGNLIVDRGSQLCDGAACWKAVATKGWLYKDKSGSADGISKLLFKGGDAGKGKASAKGKNNPAKGQVALPTGVVVALTGNATPTIQMLTSDGFCVGATITEVKKDDGLQYKAQKK